MSLPDSKTKARVINRRMGSWHTSGRTPASPFFKAVARPRLKISRTHTGTSPTATATAKSEKESQTWEFATTRGQSSYETLCQLSFQLVSRKHSQRWLRLAFRSALRRRRASARVSCRSRAPAAFPLEPRAICVRNKVAHFPAIGSVVCSSARSLTAVLTGFWTPEANLKKQMSIRCQAQIWSWH